MFNSVDMKLTCLFLVILLHQFQANCTRVAVKNGEQLIDELCSQKARDFLHIELNSTGEYIIEVNCSCVVKVRQSVVISNVGPIPASVICKHRNDSKFPSAGFAFRDSFVSISYVNFSGCGTFLSSFDADFMNSTSLKFSTTHSALFFFFNSPVNFKNVSIVYYFGFAIVGINMRESKFEGLHVADTTGNVNNTFGQAIGSGLLLIFTGSFENSAKPHVSIVSSIFYGNYDFSRTKSDECVSSHFRYFLKPRIINAAALTVLFNVQSSVEPSVSIHSSLFAYNSGSYCGGLLIAMLNSTNGRVIISNGTKFKTSVNYNRCEGSALVFYATGTLNSTATPLIIRVAEVSEQLEVIPKQTDYSGSGTLFIGIHNSNTRYSFRIEKTNFTKNEGYSHGGTCLSVVKFDDGLEVKADVFLNSVRAYENVQTRKHVDFPRGSSFTFNNINNVFIDGSLNNPSVFSDNRGSVIMTRNSHVHLRGYIQFTNNQAFNGAAFLLYDSFIYFEDRLNLVMRENSVQSTGGAIYSISGNDYVFDLPNCALQFQSDNISCDFFNNKAVLSGSSVFAYPIYSCYDLKTKEVVTSVSYYTRYLNFSSTHKSTINEMSTKASKLVPCDNPGCDIDMNTKGVHFPGQTIPLCVCALDHDNGMCIYSVVGVSLALNRVDDYKHSESIINDSEKVQFLKESTCSIVNVTVAYFDKHNVLNESLTALLSLADHVLAFDLNFTYTCPPGFYFHQGVCTCGQAVMQFYEAVNYNEKTPCDINTLSFYKPGFIAAPWLGNIYDEERHEAFFGITDLCPFDCCQTNFSMDYLIYNTTESSFQLSNGRSHVSICRDHREGTLCGKCSKGYSVVFGSSDCIPCSNWWLLTIAVYAVIGPLLIYILYTLNLTITIGTVNGVLFYAQAANVGILPFLNYFPNTWLLSKLFNVFLSSLNFNLGFRVCFYDGMNEIQKTGLTLIFPFYLLIIILLIIVVSRYSTWLSNKTSSSSIQVLVTVSHISVSKLFVTIIDVFTPVTVYVGNHTRKVWFKDGNVGFYDGSNMHLFILMGLTVVSVAIVLVPYFVLLIGGRFLISRAMFHNRFRAVYEALHGPYKENRRFWFLMRQVLLMAMFVIYSYFRGKSIHLVILVTLSLLIVFLIIQEHLKPFKNKLIGILDSSIMLNLISVYLVAWFQAGGFKAPNLQVLYILVSILVMIVFFTFLLVLCYHVFLLYRSFKCAQCYMHRKTHTEGSLLVLSNHHRPFSSFRDSSYEKEREPLIYFD